MNTLFYAFSIISVLHYFITGIFENKLSEINTKDILNKIDIIKDIESDEEQQAEVSKLIPTFFWCLLDLALSVTRIIPLIFFCWVIVLIINPITLTNIILIRICCITLVINNFFNIQIYNNNITTFINFISYSGLLYAYWII